MSSTSFALKARYVFPVSQPPIPDGTVTIEAGKIVAVGPASTGGNAEDLYTTFVEQLAKLPAGTRVYPGHDYIENNLRFTLAREPDNAAAKALLPVCCS